VDEIGLGREGLPHGLRRWLEGRDLGGSGFELRREPPRPWGLPLMPVARDGRERGPLGGQAPTHRLVRDPQRVGLRPAPLIQPHARQALVIVGRKRVAPEWAVGRMQPRPLHNQFDCSLQRAGRAPVRDRPEGRAPGHGDGSAVTRSSPQAPCLFTRAAPGALFGEGRGGWLRSALCLPPGRPRRLPRWALCSAFFIGQRLRRGDEIE
jgi:hypothetical protein